MMLGMRCPPPFRYIGEQTEMLESYPSYYWVVGRFVHPIRYIANGLPKDLQMQLIAGAINGCDMFLREPSIRDTLPRSTEKATVFHEQLIKWGQVIAGTRTSTDLGDISTLKTFLDSFSISFQDELDRLSMFMVTPKGNLDIHRLVNGASSGYPKSVLELIDIFITDEIKFAGKCLAFELPTSCGFHILRAVETAMKGYLHAATGALPPMVNRNWGEYISRLTAAAAHSDVIDVLRVLKTKRNPLMHPTDNLDIDQAISLLCLCQSAIEVLVVDIRRRSLEIKFKESLALLPTL